MAKKNRKQEEKLNVITHGIGAILAVVAMILMLVNAYQKQDLTIGIVSIVFGLSMMMLYSASTMYHASGTLRKKRFYKRIDHLSIYLLIAGTYTPFSLLGIGGTWGWTIFGIVWGLVIVGFIFKFSRWRYIKKISVTLYALMGWICVIAIKPIIENLSSEALLFLCLGGIFYTGGIFFYAKDKKPYFHPIWHLFVLAGSISHFISVYFYIMQ